MVRLNLRRHDVEHLPEVWRTHPSISNMEASNLGRLRTTHYYNPRMDQRTKHGYLFVATQRRGKFTFTYVHTAVCSAFHGPRPSAKHVVRHLDGNPHNNEPVNLAWGTVAQNASDTVRHGRSARGTRQPFAVLSDGVVLESRSRVAAGETIEAVARSLGVDGRVVGKAVAGEAWRHVGGPITPRGTKQPPRASRRKLTDKQVVEIRERAGKGESAASLSREFGVCVNTIAGIRAGRHWSWVK